MDIADDLPAMLAQEAGRAAAAVLPAARAFRRRAADGARLARELETWVAEVEDGWEGLRFGRVTARESDGQWAFEVEAYLGGLPPDAVAVELYADEVPGSDREVVAMARDGRVHGSVNGFLFRASVPARRPAGHYTPRLLPRHPEGCVPMETARVLWWRA